MSLVKYSFFILSLLKSFLSFFKVLIFLDQIFFKIFETLNFFPFPLDRAAQDSNHKLFQLHSKELKIMIPQKKPALIVFHLRDHSILFRFNTISLNFMILYLLYIFDFCDVHLTSIFSRQE